MGKRKEMKAVLTALIVIAVSAAAGEHAPLPSKLVQAKTVFLEDDTGDHKLADSVYSQLKTWERWTFVTDRSKADVLIILSFDQNSTAVVTAGSATAIGHSAFGTGIGIPVQYYVYLHVADTETGQALWTAKSRLKIGAARTAGTLLSDLKERLIPAPAAPAK